ncbi:carboxymuconolactone decarboxylase family protein [Mycobacterium sp. Aquia_213]|uniref:carboxymuconolactone decarboxylase family protein n=1 Tax=Mycobacterium sp. Aquia_213 TaxID=2991728 RepID=UPI00226E97B7|nr:carboxymuconolactone decarboxylase family protein [Mycobacterium sp. Aquia_213]WAC89936.1 carboxymuconolactone decarboxylase family protein [Mycobacterium sp. Aquia_213]
MGERIDYEAAAPRGVKLLGGVHLYVSQSGLSPVLLTCVYLRVSLINGCAYCIDMHSRELRQLGVSNEKIALVPVWQEAGELFDSRERAALAWAETVTLISSTGAPDSAYAAASAHFDEKELVDLTIAIGMMNTYNRLAISFRNPPAAAVAKHVETQGN